MNKIDLKTSNGTYMFITLSGSQYIFKITDEKMTLKRNPKDKNSSLRKDNKEIKVLNFGSIEIGKRALFQLEPLGEGVCTWRHTNVVFGIKEIMYM